MANTFKFGNGNWATKEGSALAYNDENNNFKPLPFDFTRASSATRVNKDGLIEFVGSNEPRIDFLNDSKGALLLEPSRTNIVDNSTNFFLNSWSGTRVTQGSKIVSPDGNDEAHKLVATSDNNTHYREYTLSSASAGSYTGSCFFKKGEYNVACIRMSVDTYANRYAIYIDLNDGTFLRDSTVGSPTGTSYKIENYGNGWYRLSVTIIHTSGVIRMSLSNAPSNYTNSSGLPLFLGNNSDGGYSWGAQLEVGSYATSYIPTQGSSVTRVVDSSLQGGFQDKNIFGSTQGTVVLEFKWDIGGYVFDLNDNSNVRLRIFDSGSDWKIRDFGAARWVNTGFYKSNNVKTKIAFKWNGTQFTSFQDGVKSSSTDNFTSSMAINSITYNKLNNTSNMQFYNTALTDAELIKLTS